MDQTTDAYAEHVKKIRERVAEEERQRLNRPVTCHATLDFEVVEGLRALITDNIARYSLGAQALLQRADKQLREASDVR